VLWRVSDVARVMWGWLPVGWTMTPSPSGSPRVVVTSPGQAETTTLRSLDARSGRPVWSRDLPVAAVEAFVPDPGGGADRIVMLTPDGTTQVIAADTGRTLVTGRLDVPPAATWPLDGYPGPGRPELSVAGDEVVVSYHRDNDAVITAYDLGTLTQRWRVTWAATDVHLDACGQLLCVGDQTGLRGLDPATGRERWHTRDWFAAEPFAGRLIASASGRPDSRHAIVDPQTGQTQLDMTGWSLPIGSTDALIPLVVRRDVQTGRVWVAALDPDAPALRVLGWLTGVTDNSCQSTVAYLACSTLDVNIRVWRYRP
jgi:outer membrane protein assembly factor BamB